MGRLCKNKTLLDPLWGYKNSKPDPLTFLEAATTYPHPGSRCPPLLIEVDRKFRVIQRCPNNIVVFEMVARCLYCAPHGRYCPTSRNELGNEFAAGEMYIVLHMPTTTFQSATRDFCRRVIAALEKDEAPPTWFCSTTTTGEVPSRPTTSLSFHSICWSHQGIRYDLPRGTLENHG